MTYIVFHIFAWIYSTIAFMMTILLWKRTFRLFGYAPFSEIRDMILLTMRTRGLYLFVSALMLFVWIPVTWVTEQVVSARIYPDSIRLSIGLIFFSTAILTLSRLIEPPAVLFLSGSSDNSARLLQQINIAILPLRAVALLSFRSFGRFQRFNYFINLRTTNPNVWKSVVHRLIDMVPLVVIDTRGDRHAVEEETFIMIAPERVQKAIFLGNDGDTYPALAAYGIDPSQFGIRTVTEDELLHLLQHLTSDKAYLPWPPIQQSSGITRPMMAENLDTVPSVLAYMPIDAFDSKQLIFEARTSGKDLLLLLLPGSNFTLEIVQRRVISIFFEFRHDPLLNLVFLESYNGAIIRIEFLLAVGNQVTHYQGKLEDYPLTLAQILQPHPVAKAGRQFLSELESLSREYGYTSRIVRPPTDTTACSDTQ